MKNLSRYNQSFGLNSAKHLPSANLERYRYTSHFSHLGQVFFQYFFSDTLSLCCVLEPRKQADNK
jgi:hypothetical protein